MLHATSSIRAAGFAITASLALAGAALAQQSSSRCDAIKGAVGAIKCEIGESQRRTESHKAEQVKSETEEQQAKTNLGCVQYLMKGVAEKLFTRDEILLQAGGKLSDSNACPIAVSRGYGRRAELVKQKPEVN